MISYLVFGLMYAFAAAVQPGPFQTFIISQTLSRGWKRTLPSAFAPLISDVPIIILMLFLISRVEDGFIQFLHIGGGLFLLFLSSRSFKAWRNFSAEEPTDISSSQKTLWSAALVNALNPNPYISWSLIMGPLLIKGWREAPVNGISLIVAFYGTMITCLAGIIMLFAFARNLGPKVSRISLGISVAALACFGIYQLWLGVSSYPFLNALLASSM